MEKTRSSSPGVDPRATAHEAFRDLVDRLAAVILIFGVVVVAVSILRAFLYEFRFDTFVDIFSFTGLIIVVLLRRRLSPKVAAFAWIVVLTLAAWSDFVLMGVLATGPMVVMAATILAVVILGVKVGTFVFVVHLMAIVVIGVLHSTGALSIEIDANNYTGSGDAWLNMVSILAAFTVAVLVIVDAVQRRLSQTIEQLAKKTKALKQREAEYRLLAENMEDVIFKQDADLNFTYASPSVYRMFGYSLEELPNLTLNDIMTDDSFRKAQREYRHYFERAHTGQTEVPLLTFEYIKKDGSTFMGEMRPRFVMDDEGNIIGSQGVLRDVSARVRAQEDKAQLERKLLQTEKLQALGRFAGEIAHDFKNQLSGIIGYADLIAAKTKDQEVINGYAASLLKATERATEITHELLTYARKGVRNKSPIKMHDVLYGVLEEASSGLNGHIAIHTNFDAPSDGMLGDLTQLHRALLNLVINAQEAILENGRIVVSTDCVNIDNTFVGTLDDIVKHGSYFEICINDNGPGISDENMSRIFEPFFTTKHSGSGVGLAAVWGIVKGHGGHVEVDSARGRGTTFRVLLPMRS